MEREKVPMSPYEMCISNIANAIRNSKGTENNYTAFDHAVGICTGFCKNYEEVVLDIINFKEPE